MLHAAAAAAPLCSSRSLFTLELAKQCWHQHQSEHFKELSVAQTKTTTNRTSH